MNLTLLPGASRGFDAMIVAKASEYVAMAFRLEGIKLSGGEQ